MRDERPLVFHIFDGNAGGFCVIKKLGGIRCTDWVAWIGFRGKIDEWIKVGICLTKSMILGGVKLIS